MTSVASSYPPVYPTKPHINYLDGKDTTKWSVNPLEYIYNQTNNTYTHNILNPTLTHNHTNNDWIRNIFTVDFVYDTVHNNYQTNRYDLGQISLGGNTTYGHTPGVNQYIGNDYGSGYNNYGGGYNSGSGNYGGFSTNSPSYGGGFGDIAGLLGSLGNDKSYAKPSYNHQQCGHNNNYGDSYGGGSTLHSAIKQLVSMITSVLGKDW